VIGFSTLVITGDSDEIVATADSIKVSNLISKSELEVIPETGHLPKGGPAEFALAVGKFM
jgi:pimeloyl-ACP methyl ester carboxylesterase